VNALLTPRITLALSVEQLLAPGSKKECGKKSDRRLQHCFKQPYGHCNQQNKTNTLLAASYLYAYIPDFYSLYRAETSPEIKRVRYYTRNAMLNAMTANGSRRTAICQTSKMYGTLQNIVPEEQRELPANWIIPYRSSKRFV